VTTIVQQFAAAEVEGIAALGIDPLAILAQTVTFLTLFYVVKKFALDKIVAALQQRHQKIDDGVRLGYKMEKELARLEDRIDQELQSARADADKIIKEAHQSAGGIIREAEDSGYTKGRSDDPRRPP
jgi:F-type H+-transporting ATPase subunit b